MQCRSVVCRERVSGWWCCRKVMSVPGASRARKGRSIYSKAAKQSISTPFHLQRNLVYINGKTEGRSRGWRLPHVLRLSHVLCFARWRTIEATWLWATAMCFPCGAFQNIVLRANAESCQLQPCKLLKHYGVDSPQQNVWPGAPVSSLSTRSEARFVLRLVTLLVSLLCGSYLICVLVMVMWWHSETTGSLCSRQQSTTSHSDTWC